MCEIFEQLQWKIRLSERRDLSLAEPLAMLGGATRSRVALRGIRLKFVLEDDPSHWVDARRHKIKSLSEQSYSCICVTSLSVDGD